MNDLERTGTELAGLRCPIGSKITLPERFTMALTWAISSDCHSFHSQKSCVKGCVPFLLDLEK